MTITDLIKKHASYEPRPDTKLIKKAYGFAEVAYMGQKRLSGEGLIGHALAVADILTEVRADSVTIAAALLHDIFEESNLGKEALVQEFGEEITSLVEGLTTVKKVSGKTVSRKEKDWENLRHLILATIRDPRVLAIRSAEKIHNLKTSTILPAKKQQEAARKVFDIWAPLAGTIGLYRLKSELEDLAFSILEPDKFAEIQESVQKEREKMEAVISQVKEKLEKTLKENGIEAEIAARTKHLYSVYKKMPRYAIKAGGNLYDVLGLRVITSKVEECYRILDVVRKLWKEVPDLFDDYIANPKANGYQSLHTVFSIGDYFIELQIRTRKMHEVAEYGLAAHSSYKEGKASAEGRISMLRSLVLWEKGQKLDLFPDKVFVFTPNGDVKVLVRGATPVDFAYAVHSRVGDECSGAKVDGKIVTLDYQLKTGEVVEILTKKGKKPSSDWLKFVKSEHARNSIGKVVRRG
jgi:guanosine-3',5'-bis(diphosphate) 3'-pyrophosphohydrolase